MKQKFILTVLYLSTLWLYTLAQSPGFNYQAVLRDSEGAPMPNADVTLYISLTDGPDGAVLYRESQTLTTNALGMLNTTVGNGTVETGQFADITGVQNLSIKLEANIPGEPDVVDFGFSKISVTPYALYGEDADADPDNEMQSLSLEGDSLKISGSDAISIESIKSPIEKIPDGYLLNLDGNTRNLSDPVEDVSFTRSNGVGIQTAASSQNLTANMQVFKDGSNQFMNCAGVLGDHIEDVELDDIGQKTGLTIGDLGSALANIQSGPMFTNIAALTSNGGFQYRKSRSFVKSTVQTPEMCTENFWMNDIKIGNLFNDVAQGGRGFNVNDNNGTFQAGLLVSDQGSVFAATNIATLGTTSFPAQLFNDTEGAGGLALRDVENNECIRMGKVPNGGSIIILRNETSGKSITLGFDQDGQPGIFFDGVRVVDAPTSQSIAKITDEGKTVLTNGEARIYCDKDFIKKVDISNIVINLTPSSPDSKGLAVAETFQDGFLVRELQGGKGQYAFFWQAIGPDKISKTSRPQTLPVADATDFHKELMSRGQK